MVRTGADIKSPAGAASGRSGSATPGPPHRPTNDPPPPLFRLRRRLSTRLSSASAPADGRIGIAALLHPAPAFSKPHRKEIQSATLEHTHTARGPCMSERAYSRDWESRLPVSCPSGEGRGGQRGRCRSRVIPPPSPPPLQLGRSMSHPGGPSRETVVVHGPTEEGHGS